MVNSSTWGLSSRTLGVVTVWKETDLCTSMATSPPLMSSLLWTMIYLFKYFIHIFFVNKYFNLHTAVYGIWSSLFYQNQHKQAMEGWFEGVRSFLKEYLHASYASYIFNWKFKEIGFTNKQKLICFIILRDCTMFSFLWLHQYFTDTNNVLQTTIFS